MAAIASVKGREILDSRGATALEVDVSLADGSLGRASVPSGASKGRAEAYKLEDISQAIANVDLVAKSLIGQDAANQERIDLLLINTDGTETKSNLGANVTLAISLGTAQAAAQSAKLTLHAYLGKLAGVTETPKLPIPMINLLNGGRHAETGFAFQEFMVIPKGSLSFRQQLWIGRSIYLALRTELKELAKSTAVGEEGGFAPMLSSNEEALELILAALGRTKYQPKTDVELALDIAASSIPDLKPITYPLDPISYYEKLVTDYPISILEDPLTEDDWAGWTALSQRMGGRILLAGDDLFTTNRMRLKKGITEQAANAIVIKPDQIGTLSETLQTIALARQASLKIIMSHRAGETESTLIADLAVGVGADYIKAGAPARGERVAKYNQLLRIEEELQTLRISQ